MKRAWYAGIVGTLFLVAGGAGLSLAGADDAPEGVKYSIEDVMKQGMKGGLVTKVAMGQATDEEKQTLLHMFEDMAKQKPHKGDEANWKKLNDELVAAGHDAVDGKANAGSRLKQAANCKACHDSHK